MTALKSFGRPINALVVGSSGAIGSAVVDLLAASPDVRSVLACSRKQSSIGSAKIAWRAMDILDEDSIGAALCDVAGIDLAIVATGRLHVPGEMQPEKSWRTLDKAQLSENLAINAVGPALVAKRVLPLFHRSGKSVFAALSARVGSISDNRLGGWYGYRASKAALNQLIRTFSIELARQNKDAVCVALHPGTVDSGLSRPFQSRVDAARLFTPTFAAERLLSVIDKLDPSFTGQLIAWDGTVIDP